MINIGYILDNIHYNKYRVTVLNEDNESSIASFCVYAYNTNSALRRAEVAPILINFKNVKFNIELVNNFNDDLSRFIFKFIDIRPVNNEILICVLDMIDTNRIDMETIRNYTDDELSMICDNNEDLKRFFVDIITSIKEWDIMMVDRIRLMGLINNEIGRLDEMCGIYNERQGSHIKPIASQLDNLINKRNELLKY